jgi:type VI secretion system protein ImpJ
MADSRVIKWIDGEILCGKKLEKSGELIRSYVYSLVANGSSYSQGIWRLKINELALQNRKLQIDNLGCVFPDGTLVDEDYSLPEKKPIIIDLNAHAKEMVRGKIFYIMPHGQSEDNITLGSPIDPTIVTLTSPAIKIISEPGKNAIVFAKIIINPLGQLEVVKDFSGSLLKIDKENAVFKHINELLSKVRSMSMLLQRQLEQLKNAEDLLRFRSWNMAGCYLNNLIEELRPWVMHKILLLVCGELSWIVGKVAPAESYNHGNSLEGIQKMLHFIQEILNNKQVVILEPIMEKDHLYFDIKNHSYRAIYVAIGPVSPESESWIKGANIGSRSIFETLRMKRFIGAEREISQQGSQGIWLKLNLDSKYFSEKEDLMISLPKDNLFQLQGMSCKLLLEQ